MRAPEAHVLFLDADPGSATACVYGGTYLVLLDCTSTHLMQLYLLDSESTMYAPVGPTFVTAGGGSYEVDLPPGVVAAIINTSTANTLTLARIPEE